MRLLARALGRVPSRALRVELVRQALAREPQAILDALGPALNRLPRLGTMPLDLDPAERLDFEDLAGLFANTSLNHGVVGMTVRQLAYVFGLARREGARTAIEIGRWRGGTTVALAAAMAPRGKVWSIDVGEKEARFGADGPSFDEETRSFCERFDLDVELIVGDSRTIEVETGEVDLVLIDGDHSYEGTTIDFERFGRRVRDGGAVLFDDAYPEPVFGTYHSGVRRAVDEIVASGEFRLVNVVDRLAHLARVV